MPYSEGPRWGRPTTWAMGKMTLGNRVADLEIGQTRGLCDEPKFRIDGTQ